MAEEIVEALNGKTEIIEDFLDQIRRKLNNSCDLRETDCYSRGYSATADIHMKLYDVDIVSLDMKVEVNPTVEPPVSTNEAVVTPIEIEEKVIIEQEENLTAVRERFSQPETLAPSSDQQENVLPGRQKRKYTRRMASLESLATSGGGGGATDLTE
jgi:hypothetical protein